MCIRDSVECAPEQRRLDLLPAESGREVQQRVAGEQALREVAPGRLAVERERFDERVEAVSYTHLDVYKRQSLNNGTRIPN